MYHTDCVLKIREGDDDAHPIKRRRVDVEEKPDAATTTVDPFNVETWSPRAKYLISKLRLLRFIDETTPTYVIHSLAKSADKMFIYAGYGKTGNATALLRRLNIENSTVDRVLKAEYATLASENERQDKDIYWTFASAFLICFYEVKIRKPFCIQYYHSQQLVAEFLKFYPEFSNFDGMAINRLLTFHLCMQVAVSAFGDYDMNCLLELVTRMAEGREVALSTNRPELMPFSLMSATVPGNLTDCKRSIFRKICEVKKYPTPKGCDTSNKEVRFAGQLKNLADCAIEDNKKPEMIQVSPIVRRDTALDYAGNTCELHIESSNKAKESIENIVKV